MYNKMQTRLYKETFRFYTTVQRRAFPQIVVTTRPVLMFLVLLRMPFMCWRHITTKYVYAYTIFVFDQ